MPFIFLLLASGCAGLRSSSSSKNAEIFVPKMAVEVVQENLTLKMTLREFQLKTRTLEKAVYIRPKGSFTAGGLYSSGPTRNSEAFLEITCAFTESSQGVRILGSSRVLENPGSVNERYVDEDEWDVLHEIQTIFHELKRKLETLPK